jgi:DNA-binding transcriptional regulator YiaG
MPRNRASQRKMASKHTPTRSLSETTAQPPTPALTARQVSVAPAARINGPAIARLRSDLAVSQAVFAQALNVSPETIRGWEQGKRNPDGASLRLLELAMRHPEWVVEAMDHHPAERRKKFEAKKGV